MMAVVDGTYMSSPYFRFRKNPPHLTIVIEKPKVTFHLTVVY